MLIPVKNLLGIQVVLFLRSLVFVTDLVNARSALLRLLSNAVDRAGILGASKVVCMTHAMQKDLRRFLEKPTFLTEILANDIPARGAPAHDAAAIKRLADVRALIKPGTITALTSGILDRRKNVAYLLRVFALLSQMEAEQKLILLIAGDGPLLDEHRRFVRQRNLSNVHFVGWWSSTEPLLDVVDVVLHSAKHEGMPNSIMEALAHNVPVLAADTPELRELLHHESLLFSLDGDMALAVRLVEITKKPGQLADLRKLTAERAGFYRFDWDDKASRLVLEN